VQEIGETVLRLARISDATVSALQPTKIALNARS